MGTQATRAVLISAVLIIILPGLVGGCTSTAPTYTAVAIVRPATTPPAPPPPITEILEGEQAPSKDKAPPRLPEVAVVEKRPVVEPPREQGPSAGEKVETVAKAFLRLIEYAAGKNPWVDDGALGPSPWR